MRTFTNELPKELTDKKISEVGARKVAEEFIVNNKTILGLNNNSKAIISDLASIKHTKGEAHKGTDFVASLQQEYHGIPV